MARKTIDMLALRTAANRRLLAERPLLDEIPAEQAFRMGVASLLEWALHETGNYRGFHYVDTDDKWVKFERGVTDETRRHYS